MSEPLHRRRRRRRPSQDQSLAATSNNNYRGRRGRRRKHEYKLRYLLQRVIGAERYHFDEQVVSWTFEESQNPDRSLNRVIKVLFDGGAKAAIKIGDINNLYQYLMNVRDPETNEMERIHAIESILNSGRIVRFRFGPSTEDECIDLQQAEREAEKFYNELSERMNLPVASNQ